MKLILITIFISNLSWSAMSLSDSHAAIAKAIDALPKNFKDKHRKAIDEVKVISIKGGYKVSIEAKPDSRMVYSCHRHTNKSPIECHKD